jgi:nickel-dependent lactate racemase
MIGTGRKGLALGEAGIRELCATEVSGWNIRGKRVLLVAPDQTRTAPMGLMFRILHDLIAGDAAAFDVLVALGTHPPLTEEAIDRRFEITSDDRRGRYAKTRFYNHRWNDPSQLVSLGLITEQEVLAISGGLMCERVNVTISSLALTYDLLLIVGPTFPHEVVGFSGGNKYLFPGISGREIIDMFHWLGALITSPAILGVKHTSVRAVVDRAASMVPVERKCISLVMEGNALAGLYAGSPEEAWSAAADLSEQIHVVYHDRPYRSVLSSAPTMYDELWVGAKCAYKLEPVVADGGELIIYAPHMSCISATHGESIRRIGYHVRDYFVRQLPRFADVPRAVMAHSTHLKGAGTYEDGIERPRIHVTLATRIGANECQAVHLGYRDFERIDVEAWRGREREGLLFVPRAGETLFRLKKPDVDPPLGPSCGLTQTS